MRPEDEEIERELAEKAAAAKAQAGETAPQPEVEPAPEAEAAPEGSEPAGETEEAEEEGTDAEKKEKKYWPAALALMLLLLAGGGYYALTGMRQTAHQLGGGSEYGQLSANSEVYDGAAGSVSRNGDYFPLDEETARKAAYRARAAETPGGDRLNPAVVRTKGELAADASGSGAPSAAAAVGREDEPAARDNAPAGARQQGAMGEKLQAKAFFSGGPGSARSKGAPAGNTAAFEGSAALAGKASAQRETGSFGKPKQAGKGSVMESLKGAFRASFYGARLSSQDAAKGWISRAFDATPEAETAIEYDEKIRAKLDRVNPDSIPQFLRDQDVNAAEAKRLTTSDVGKPDMDREGTKEALAEDKDYQKKKMAKDFASSMINGLFAGVSGTGSENPGDNPGGPTSLSITGDGGDESYQGFSDPEDEQYLLDQELEDWVQTNGFGGECGCTEAAPCCCMPGAGTDSGGGSYIGDFPEMGGDIAYV